jgi:hypothetical protein
VNSKYLMPQGKEFTVFYLSTFQTSNMNDYTPRYIRFEELISIQDWKVKVYSISENEHFDHPEFFTAAIAELPKWLSIENSFNSKHEGMAFLILHSATEGFFSLINWWVGENMLNTHIFLTPKGESDHFKIISGDGLSPCIWELEVIDHERRSWLEYVLKRAPSPRYDEYLDQRYNGLI